MPIHPCLWLAPTTRQGAGRQLRRLNLADNRIVTYAVKRAGVEASAPPAAALSGAEAIAAAAVPHMHEEGPYDGTEPFDMVKPRGGGGVATVANPSHAHARAAPGTQKFRGVYVPDLRGVEAIALAVGGAAALSADMEEVRVQEVHLRTGGAGPAHAEFEEALAVAETRLSRLSALLERGLAGVRHANAEQIELRAGQGAGSAAAATALAAAETGGGLLSGLGGGGGGFCSQLRWLDISRNPIGVAGGVAFGEALRGARRLECFVARSCELSGVLPASVAAGAARRAGPVAPGAAPPSAAGEYDGAASEALAIGAAHASTLASFRELDLRDNVVGARHAYCSDLHRCASLGAPLLLTSSPTFRPAAHDS